MSHLYDGIVENTLNDIMISEKGDMIGYVNSLEEVNSLLSQLKRIGFTFSTRTSNATNHNQKPKEGQILPDLEKDSQTDINFYFRYRCKDLPIKFFGSAFSIESTVYRQCSLGPRYYRKRGTAPIPAHLEDHIMGPQQKRFRKSKKANCPGTFNVKCLKVYPDFFVEHDFKWRPKKLIIESLKAALNSPTQPRYFFRYYIQISPSAHHTHQITDVPYDAIVLSGEDVFVDEQDLAVQQIEVEMKQDIEPDEENGAREEIETDDENEVCSKSETDDENEACDKNETDDENNLEELHLVLDLDVEHTLQRIRDQAQHLTGLTYLCKKDKTGILMCMQYLNHAVKTLEECVVLPIEPVVTQSYLVLNSKTAEKDYKSTKRDAEKENRTLHILKNTILPH